MSDFVFMEKTHPNMMLGSLNRLWLKKEFCDVILCCGGKEFPCHRIVLASFSSYFEAMFTTGMMESRQEKVDMITVGHREMELLVSYAYTSEVVISGENVEALLAAAHLLNITAVQEACCHYMESHMDENNCVGIHCLAETYSFKMLEKRSMDSVVEHFSVVYKQEEFLSLSVDKLTEILASNDLNVTREETAFEAAMLWLNHSLDRKQSFEKVMEHIRLTLIDPSYLDGVKASLDVVESQAFQRLTAENKNHTPRWSTGPCEVILMVTDHQLVTFHPPTNRWKTLASLPFTGPGLVASGSTVYMAGGRYRDGIVSRQMWSYDYSHHKWKKLAPMNEAHCDFALVMLDDYVYAVDRLWDQSVDRYDPKTDSWQLMESNMMPDLCTGSAVVALDGFIYATGWDTMYKYNPRTSVWTVAATIQVPRSGSAVCAHEGKIYVIGGQHYEYTDKVECFSPETNQWSTCSSMKKPRYHPGAAVVDGKIYVLGGMDDTISDLRCIESFDEQTETWTILGEMDTCRSCFNCVSVSKR